MVFFEGVDLSSLRYFRVRREVRVDVGRLDVDGRESGVDERDSDTLCGKSDHGRRGRVVC